MLSTTLVEDVELSELRAKRFIEDMPSKEFKIVANKDGKAEIKCLICFPPKKFALFGRPGFESRIKTHANTNEHIKQRQSLKECGNKRQSA